MKRFSEAVTQAAKQYIDDAESEYGTDWIREVKRVLGDFPLYVKETRDFDAPFTDFGDGTRKFVVLTETDFETLSYIYRDWMTAAEGNPYEEEDFDTAQEYEDYEAVIEAGRLLLPQFNEASEQLLKRPET